MTREIELKDRSKVLLKATLDILKSCSEGPYVKDALSEVAVWDEVECDGHCLMEDIEDLLSEFAQLEESGDE